jgi:hypothetical protein
MMSEEALLAELMYEEEGDNFTQSKRRVEALHWTRLSRMAQKH